MIQLDEVHIEEFRGIRKLTLQMDRSSFAIHGPNGSGKSGVVDAIEFGLTGDISRLSGTGTSGLSVKMHGPHVDTRGYPDKAFVRLKVYLPSLDKTATITRKVKSPKALTVVPDDIDVRAVLDEVALHPELTLTRRQIIKFILTEASNRSKEIQSLLRLEAIDGTRASLKTAMNRTNSTLSSAESKCESSVDALRRHLDLPKLVSSEILAVVNKHRTALKLPVITEFIAGTSFTDGITDKRESTNKPNKESAIRDVKATADAVIKAEGDKNPSISLIIQLAKLTDDPELFVALQRRSFVQTGLGFVDSDECPLCDKSWDLNQLKAHLRAKLEKSKEAEVLECHLKDAAQRVCFDLNALRELSIVIQTVAKQLEDEESEVVLKKWADDLLAFKTKLQTVEGAVAEKDHLAEDWIQVPDALPVVLKSMSKQLMNLPDHSEATNAITFLVLAQERLTVYRQSKREKAKRKRSNTVAHLIYKAYCDASKEVLEGLYTDVEEAFAASYRAINHDDEGEFTAKLSPSEGKLELFVDFHKRGLFHPGAYHSEGHQDGMGLCLYLALMKLLLGNDFRLAILDDVVMSVDNQHRKELCSLLKAEFPNTQFVITTHDQTWFYQMQHAGLVARKSSMVFRSWTVDDGPMVSNSTDVWNDIESALAAEDVPRAASALRRHLEFVSGELADCLVALTPHRIDGNYDLGDLLPSVIGQYNKLLKKCADSAQAWKNDDAKTEIETRKAIFSAVAAKSNVEQWAVNKAVHFNEWADFVREDYEPVVTVFKELLECFQCPSCSSWLNLIPRKGPGESLRCDCSRIFMNMSKP